MHIRRNSIKTTLHSTNRRLVYRVLNFDQRARAKKHPFATNEANDNEPEASSPERRGYRQIVFAGTGSEATGRLFFVPAPARRLYRSSDLLGWASAATELHAGIRDGNTAIERLFWDAKMHENPGLRRRRFCVGPADGLGCTTGLRRSCCDCSGGPTSRNGDLSPLKQPTTPQKICVPRFGYYVEHAMSRWTNMHVPSRLEKKRYRFVPRGLCGQRRVHRGILVRPHYATDFIRKRFASQLKFPIKHGKGKNGTSSAG